jgi:putative transposase
MPQSLSKLTVHIIFSTKNRKNFIKDTIKKELYSYMSGILKNHDSPCITIGGTQNHVHILCVQSKNYSMAKLIEEVKKSSSKWIKTMGNQYSKFRWQNGYGVFSVSQSNVEKVKTYISNQTEHHRKKSFTEEFRNFLKRYEMFFDERYVWN